MDKYIYDDKNGLWGQRHLRYLKEYRIGIYTTLLTSGRLNVYLADIDKQHKTHGKGSQNK